MVAWTKMLTLAELAQEELAGDDPLQLSGQDSEWVSAEALRKIGDYAKAGPFFCERWKEERTAAAGWRYGYCLRKGGHAEAGLRLIFRVAQVHPEDPVVCQERFWSIYEARLKPASSAGQHRKVLQIAEEMVAGADQVSLKVVAFLCFKAAKESREWDTVLLWCSRLDLSQLSIAPRKMGERKSISDRERYYFAQVKALVELKRWEEALLACEAASKDFPRNQDFVRWKAQSLAGLGDVSVAIRLLQDLRRGGRCRWYIVVDLAKILLQEGEPQQAWEACLEAVAAQVEDNHKLGLLELMAQILIELEREEAALDHVGWCLALRQVEGWGKTPLLEELEKKLIEPDLMDPSHWKERARQHWRRELGPPVSSNQPRREGVVEQFLVHRNYCFVACEGQLYYTLVRDVPQECRRDGARVWFRLAAHFDAKKKVESQRAVQISVFK
jgi:tetratricopeptide (TPR) repeat protein